MTNHLKTRLVVQVCGEHIFYETATFADESPLCLAVGGRVVTKLMATPGHERELAAGYALTMGWAQPTEPPPLVVYDSRLRRVDLDLKVDTDKLDGVRAAGGGLLGPTEAGPLPPGGGLELDVLRTLTDSMSNRQVLYRPTRGTHAAALFSAQGEMLALAEDVGRHNGLDKAVGAAWLDGSLSNAAALALSGRCSLEMVLKSARSGVGVVVSVSAPTVPAVETADRLGLTLVNCPRAEEVRIYSNPARISRQGRALAISSHPPAR